MLIADAPTNESKGSSVSLNDSLQALVVLGADVQVASLSRRSAEVYIVDEISVADLVFLTTHGLCGEDGSLSFLLKMLKTPHTGPKAAVHALCLNKVVFKLLATKLGIQVPTMLADRADHESRVIKPVSGGGSLGVYYRSGPGDSAMNSDETAFIERFVDGTFVTCAIFPWLAHDLPLLQIVHEQPIFSYSAKRNPSDREEVCPASISERAERDIRHSAELLYKTLAATGPLRFDYIVDVDDSTWLLEANTIPGLSRQSNLACIATTAGYSYESLIAAIALEALDRPLP